MTVGRARPRSELAGEHACRGAGHDDVEGFGVEHTTDEPVPTVDELDLVEEPRCATLAPELWMAEEVLLQQGIELGGINAGETVVVETEIDCAFRCAGPPCCRQ
jgi:hypothetical protein